MFAMLEEERLVTPRGEVEVGVLETLTETGRAVKNYLSKHVRIRAGEHDVLLSVADDCVHDVGLLFRPFLLQVAYKSGGGSFESILPVAAGVELIQLSTLVVDDVLDKSAIRNGRPSACAKWGGKIAMVTGIVMMSAGFKMVIEGLQTCFTCRDELGVLNLLHHTHERIYVGQAMDIEREGDTRVSEQWYLGMIANTTAYFIQAPLVVGAMLWDAPKAILDCLSKTGYNLGMAYQIRDDVIDILGDPELTGKPRAGDIRQRKMRLPVIHALANAKPDAVDEVQGVYSQDRQPTEFEIERVIEVLTEAGSIDYAIAKAQEYCDAAIEETRKLLPEHACLVERLNGVADLIGLFEEEPNGEVE